MGARTQLVPNGSVVHVPLSCHGWRCRTDQFSVEMCSHNVEGCLVQVPANRAPNTKRHVCILLKLLCLEANEEHYCCLDSSSWHLFFFPCMFWIEGRHLHEKGQKTRLDGSWLPEAFHWYIHWYTVLQVHPSALMTASAKLIEGVCLKHLELRSEHVQHCSMVSGMKRFHRRFDQRSRFPKSPPVHFDLWAFHFHRLFQLASVQLALQSLQRGVPETGHPPQFAIFNR